VFLWVYSAGYAFTAAFAVAVIRFRWHTRLRPGFEPAFLWRLLRPGVALALGFTLVTVYAQVDIVLLQLLKTYRMVGWYSAANKYIDAIAWIPQSAMGAVFPVLSLLSTGSGERLRQAYVTSYRMLALLGVPLAVGIGLAAAPIVQLTSGFPQSTPALQLLAPSIALLFVNNAFLYTLTAMNRQVDFTRLALIGLLVNLALNLALIPGFGYLGAAAASTLTELALFLGGWWLLRRHGYRLAPLSSIGRVLLSGALSGVAVFFLLRLLPVLAVIPIAAAVYLAAVVALRALSPAEWAVVRAGLLGGRRR
jgi:O-antigen/teichoic acid export membrane protein